MFSMLLLHTVCLQFTTIYNLINLTGMVSMTEQNHEVCTIYHTIHLLCTKKISEALYK